MKKLLLSLAALAFVSYFAWNEQDIVIDAPDGVVVVESAPQPSFKSDTVKWSQVAATAIPINNGSGSVVCLTPITTSTSASTVAYATTAVI